MAIFSSSMAKDEKPSDVEKGTPNTPEGRPGTAGTTLTTGTEAFLSTNTRKASDNFKKAQKAEQAYRARKRAASARQGYNDAAGHFKESFVQLGLGFKKIFKLIVSIPYIISVKREASRRKKEEKQTEKAMRQKEALEERLAKQAEAAAEDEAAANADRNKRESKE